MNRNNYYDIECIVIKVDMNGNNYCEMKDIAQGLFFLFSTPHSFVRRRFFPRNQKQNVQRRYFPQNQKQRGRKKKKKRNFKTDEGEIIYYVEKKTFSRTCRYNEFTKKVYLLGNVLTYNQFTIYLSSSMLIYHLFVEKRVDIL